MINYLKTQGLDQKTISIIVVMLAAFLVIFGLTVLGLAVYDTVKGLPIQPWMSGVLFGLGTFGINMVSGAHTATTIDGTATKTAAAVSAGYTEAINQQLVSNTQATQANTQAVKEST